MVSYEKNQSGSQQSIISRLSSSFFIIGHRVMLWLMKSNTYCTLIFTIGDITVFAEKY